MHTGQRSDHYAYSTALRRRRCNGKHSDDRPYRAGFLPSNWAVDGKYLNNAGGNGITYGAADGERMARSSLRAMPSQRLRRPSVPAITPTGVRWDFVNTGTCRRAQTGVGT